MLIPGCGSAYEVKAFHDAGWAVMAIDFSPEAVTRAKKLLGPLGDRVVLGDFFKHPFNAQEFDVVYERTFLCALPPELWNDYGTRMQRLLRPAGMLVGFFLYGEEPEPPPYPLTPEWVETLFCGFKLVREESVPDSLPIFEGKERWQEWKRREQNMLV